MTRDTRTTSRKRSLTVLTIAIALVAGVAVQVNSPVTAAAVPPPPPGTITSVDLNQVGFSDLASFGLDGQTKPRGQNGDVAVIGNTAFVAGGALFNGNESTSGRICTDYGGVKVVDISNPATPTVTNTITIQDVTGVVSGPLFNARRGTFNNNVSVSVSALDVIHHPGLNKDILGIATQRCEQSFFNGGRVEFWDVTTPTSPTLFQIYDGTQVGTGAPWGIFYDIKMFTRNNGPGGSTKVYATMTTPFSVGNAHDATRNGDFRLLDISAMAPGPTQPPQIGNFPTASIGSNSNNGCRIFHGGRSATPTPDKSNVMFSFYDGAQPANSVIEPTGLGGPNSAAVMQLDLDNMPVFDENPSGQPRTFTPNPKTFGYPPGKDGGMDPGGIVEGNAADVATFTGPTGEVNTVVSEDDVDPALLNVQITSPTNLFRDTRGCEAPIAKRISELPGQQLAGQIAYVGRGCPASALDKDTLPVDDPYLENPAGKIVLFESGGSGFNGCGVGDKVKRAAAAGAIGVVGNLGCCPSANLFIVGNDGPFPQIPLVGLNYRAFDKMNGYVPSRLLTGVNYPATYQRSTASNVTVKPYALALASPGATNAAPIEITTAAHGLTTGDKVTISGVVGNTAANGNWTVTVTSTTKFTLNGSAGNGAWAGGGTVLPCPNSDPSCAATPTRTDFSRLRSKADVTDPVASGNVNSTVVTLTAPVVVPAPVPVPFPSQNFNISIQALPAALNSGTTIRFTNGEQVILAAAASAGATTLLVSYSGLPNSPSGPIPSGTTGSPTFDVTPGQSYQAGAYVELDSPAAGPLTGTFSTDVLWFDAGGAQIGSSNIASLSAVTPRSRFSQTVTAPPGAARGSVKFGWTGAGAQGIGYVDLYSFVPTGLAINLQSLPGHCPGFTSWPPTPGQCGAPEAQWGEQKIVNFSAPTPTQVGTYRSPGSLAWPPPDNGIYNPRQARMFADDVAFSTWMSDGLRVVDVRNPAAPQEKASFDPPGVADPTPTAGSGVSNRAGNAPLVRGPSWPTNTLFNGIDFKRTGPNTGYAVISDINAGLYVVQFTINRSPANKVADFNANGTSEISVFRPSEGNWYTKDTQDSGTTANYGTNGDVPVNADYDGDGANDFAVYRPGAQSVWYVKLSGGGETSLAWGTNSDLPVPADYDGDGKTDIGVFRPSNGTWYIRLSSTPVTLTVPYGITGDVPVPADYDGDGRADIAVYRSGPQSYWFIRATATNTEIVVPYGTSGDVPVRGDYDGDGKADVAIFRPSSGTWFVKLSGGGELATTYGTSGDIPSPADYDRDGKTDLAVFRPSSGVWYVLRSSTNTELATGWGTTGDIPAVLPAAVRMTFFP